MRLIAAGFALIAVYGWPLTSNACGGAESDGNCWLALQQEQKLAFVIGFDTGTQFYETARSLDDPFVSLTLIGRGIFCVTSHLERS